MVKDMERIIALTTAFFLPCSSFHFPDEPVNFSGGETASTVAKSKETSVHQQYKTKVGTSQVKSQL